MQPEDFQVEIEELKLRLVHFEELFDLSIRDSAGFNKTKLIFHELKKINDRLTEIIEIQNRH
jgi:hypothetical protein